RVTQDNMGKKSAGVDGVKLVPPECRPGLAASLRLDGEAAPVRRGPIPQPGGGGRRPPGNPPLPGPAVRAPCPRARDTGAGGRVEPNSYGFRPGRSCWDAVQAIYITVRWKAKYVLDADIAKCFDRIDHEALLDKVSAGPTVARQLRAWLKAGVLDGETLFPS